MKPSFLLIALIFAFAVGARADSPADAAAPPPSSPEATEMWGKITDANDKMKTAIQARDKAAVIALLPTFRHDLHDFVDRFPSDPNVPQAKLAAASADGLAQQVGAADAPTTDEVNAEYAALSSDASLPTRIRVQAGMNRLQGSFEEAMGQVENEKTTPATWVELDKQIAHFEKAFGDAPEVGGVIAQIRQEEFELLGATGDDARIKALADKLADDPHPEVAMIAKKTQAREKTMADLRAHPVELKLAATDGRSIDLASLRGKVVLVDFWATWCGPCVEEMPAVRALYQKYHDQGLEIVGISLDQDPQALAQFVKTNAMPWPQSCDGKSFTGSVPQRFGVAAIPSMWVFDRKGLLVATPMGPRLPAAVAKAISSK
jgi:thiol-disulfide isomerase/thioredoxin